MGGHHISCRYNLDLTLLQGSNESSDDEGAPRQSQIYSDGDTDPGITDPGITMTGLSEYAYGDAAPSRRHSIDPMTSMGSTAFWDPPDLQHPANTMDSSNSESGTVTGSSGADPSQGGSSSGAQSVAVKVSPASKRIARVRKRHLGMLQTMLEASRRAAEFVTSVRWAATFGPSCCCSSAVAPVAVATLAVVMLSYSCISTGQPSRFPIVLYLQLVVFACLDLPDDTLCKNTF